MTTLLKLRRKGVVVTRLAMATMLTLAMSSAGNAEESDSESPPVPTLVRVEEDWIAVVGEPDPLINSPQILNIISPNNSTDGVFGMLQVNHRGAPQFLEGGLQLQGWNGDSMYSFADASKTVRLYRNSDNVRYTVGMEVVTDGIRFELRNGRSLSWRRFHTTTPLTVTVPSSSTPTLDGYSTDHSLANTTVNVGAHRVKVLFITAVRKTYSDGAVVTDNTDRVLHSYQLNVEDVSTLLYVENPGDYNTENTEVAE
jgi:hypothetical protein